MPKLLTEPFIQKRVISYLSEVKGFNKPVKPTGNGDLGKDDVFRYKNETQKLRVVFFSGM